MKREVEYESDEDVEGGDQLDTEVGKLQLEFDSDDDNVNLGFENG